MRVTGGEPAEKVLLYPNELNLGITAKSVLGSANLQTGLAIYGTAFDLGMNVQRIQLQIGSGRTLYYADPKIIGDLDEMTLDNIPFE